MNDTRGRGWGAVTVSQVKDNMCSDKAVEILKRKRLTRCLTSILSGPSDQLNGKEKEKEKSKITPRFLT